MSELLRVEGLSKSFGSLKANDGIDLDIATGELHCLFGENGAGKSTLSACLYGYQRPDAGRLTWKDKPVSFSSSADAIACGIGMVHQHFVLVPEFTVLENIIVGTHRRGWRLREAEARIRINEICQRYGLVVDLDAFVWQLSVGEQQWVEILKALYLGAELLILDEPTAVLTPQESDRLFGIIGTMRAAGLAVIIITHKLSEVMQSDRVTVLRRGRKVATLATSETDTAQLTELMVGEPISLTAEKPERTPGRVVVQVSNLSCKGVWNEVLVDDVTFAIREGEILGIAGVAGNGQKPLTELLAGIRRPHAGSIAIGDRQIEGASPAEFMAAGVGLVPDDRFGEALVGPFPIADNLILGSQRQAWFRDGILLRPDRIAARAMKAMTDFAIAAPSIFTRTDALSGGNAQKVVLARELEQARVLLVANQPTRGLDVGVIARVHAELLRKRHDGCAILYASDDLDNLLALSDRLAVMFAGRIVAIVDPRTTSLARIGALMAGRLEDAA